jgi:glycosyltransferase involved in cell wall biosynthesis
LHIGLNLMFLVPGETGGTEIYARELIPRLVAAAPRTRFTAFVNREAAEAADGPWGELIPMITVPVRARNRFEWVRGEQQLLPPLAQRARVDLVHSLANTAPTWGRFRRVVTIHDLIYEIVPAARSGLRARGMRLLLPLAARRADRVIVDAAATGEDLRTRVGISGSKIDVIPLGLGSPRRVSPLAEAELRRRLGARNRPIVLTVSAKLPHKNLPRLIGALAAIPTDARPLLVLPGYPTQHEGELRSRAEQLGVSDDIRLLGWVSAEELEGLYAAAGCFVFPSLYEGFGLPVLEAMARGVPVACSGRGALLEVAGQAALLFDPESETAISEAIQRLLGDRDRARDLVAAGRRQVARFSWGATAARTLAVYERAASRPSAVRRISSA